MLNRRTRRSVKKVSGTRAGGQGRLTRAAHEAHDPPAGVISCSKPHREEMMPCLELVCVLRTMGVGKFRRGENLDSRCRDGGEGGQSGRRLARWNARDGCGGRSAELNRRTSSWIWRIEEDRFEGMRIAAGIRRLWQRGTRYGFVTRSEFLEVPKSPLCSGTSSRDDEFTQRLLVPSNAAAI